MVSAEAIREIKVRDGRLMIERAEQARINGQIKDYVVCVLADDPAIVDHITIIKHGN